MKIFDITILSAFGKKHWETETEFQQSILFSLDVINLTLLIGNLSYMTYVFVRYIHRLKIKNKIVRLFYGIAFIMTTMYIIFQLNGFLVGGANDNIEDWNKTHLDVRNISLSLAKLFDAMLSL